MAKQCKSVWAAAVMLISAAGMAAAKEPRDLSEKLEEIRARNNVPALWAATTSSEGLLGLGVTGVRRRGDDTKAQVGDLIHIGSCTKAMTATLCAILVAEGALKWDDKIAVLFPGVKADEAWANATLEMLCTNRAGVAGEPKREDWLALWTHRGEPIDARRMLTERLLAAAPARPPGAGFEYSNFSFTLAGHAAELAGKEPYETLIVKKLFAPLGITTVGFGAPGTPGKADQPRGHTDRGVAMEPTPDGRGADNPPAVTPAGRVHLSIADWAKYAAFHLRGAQWKEQDLGGVKLGREVFGKLHGPPDALSDYAFGWIMTDRPWAGPTPDRQFVLNHAGSNTMWFAAIWIAPEIDRAFLAVSNQSNRAAQKAVDEAVSAMIKQFGPPPPTPPTPPAAPTKDER